MQKPPWAVGATLTLVGLLLLALGPPMASAQTADTVPSARLSDLAGVDLVSLRPDELLAQRREHAEEIIRSLDQRTRLVRAAREELRAGVDIKKNEIDITETRRDLANRQKRQADRDELDRLKQRQEQERRLLERQVETADRKLRFYSAQGELMQAQITAFGRESELNARLADLEAARTDDRTPPREMVLLKRQIGDLERATLTALEKVAEAEHRAADRRRDFIRAQLEVIKARAELIARGG